MVLRSVILKSKGMMTSVSVELYDHKHLLPQLLLQTHLSLKYSANYHEFIRIYMSLILACLKHSKSGCLLPIC